MLTPSHAECLHGHNYQMRVSIKVSDLDPNLGFAFDFNLVKPMIKALCDGLDEKILLPKNSPYVTVESKGSQINVQFGEKKYSFPKSDSIILPISNVTSEELARWMGLELKKKMKDVPRFLKLRVSIEETRGQSVSFTI
ncbi:MAG: 6-pyruvoyl tetrahydropterin synthase [Bdellovibrionales bacterium]|nr:6-pyruvoyl tetrahydropterin synthase [Bdellovibrionales bacterium]